MLSVELTVHRGRSGTETATEPSLRRTGPYFQQRSPGRTTDVCTDYYAPTVGGAFRNSARDPSVCLSVCLSHGPAA